MADHPQPAPPTNPQPQPQPQQQSQPPQQQPQHQQPESQQKQSLQGHHKRSPSMAAQSAIKIVAGSSNPAFADKICAHLGVKRTPCKTGTFSDGEMRVQIEESVRGHEVFIVQSICSPVNDLLMELLLFIDALKRASARSITVVMPYYAYSRQDKRKKDERRPIAARLVADLIMTAGAHRVLTVDVHADQVQGFFKIPFDNLHFIPLMAEHIKGLQLDNTVIVAIGKAATAHARLLAKHLLAPMVVVDSRKGLAHDLPEAATDEEAQAQFEAASYVVIGDVKDCSCVVVDDILDLPRMLCTTISLLREGGAKSCLVAGIHGMFTPEGVRIMKQANVDHIICSNTVDCAKAKEHLPNLTMLDCSGLLADAIKKVHTNESLD